MDITKLFDEGLHMNWERRQRLSGGPIEFQVKYADCTGEVWFTCINGGHGEWMFQAWHQNNSDAGICTLRPEYVGFLTAADAMRACERWLLEHAD